MSRFTKLWALAASLAALLAAVLLPGTATPASATSDQPPAPTAHDVCGVSQDQFYVPAGQPGTDTGWKDSNGNLYGPNTWNSTGGAASVTLTAKVWSGGYAEYTYPPLTFGTEPDSACTQAPDTVTAVIGACHPGGPWYGNTTVTFTYTNVADGTGWSATDPQAVIYRVDGPDGRVYFDPSGTKPIADGQSVSVTSGDNWQIDYYETPWAYPGTHTIYLQTAQTPQHQLAYTFVVPECGQALYPYGDPLVGRPKAKIGRCHHGRVAVTLDNRKGTAITNYEVYTRTNRVKHVPVAPDAMKTVVLRKQRTGSTIAVSPHLESVPGPQGKRGYLAVRHLHC